MRPLYILPLVFLLLLFEHELDEELLQFLVAIIDTDLLETVLLKDLEPVNVQDTDHSAFTKS